MCFGNAQVSSTTSNNTGTTTPSQYLTNAATTNVTDATNLQSTPFMTYSGQMTAPLSNLQTSSFQPTTSLAQTLQPSTNYIPTAYSNIMSGSSNEPTINAGSIAGGMTPFMNQYVSQALSPQIAANANNQALQTQLMQGQATSAGAFNDPRANTLQSNMGLNYSLENQGLVGSAYTNAFNTAIGGSAQQQANQLTAQNSTANLMNTGLGLQQNAANSLVGNVLQTSGQQNTFGSQVTAQNQAALNAQYNQWLLAQQYPFLTTANTNSAIGAGVPASPTSSTGTGSGTLSQPNNSGFALLGSLAGAAGSALGGGSLGNITGSTAGSTSWSDVRLKKDVSKVGKLDDGLNVYTFRYKGEKKTVPLRLGLMAQEVEEAYPSAVKEIGGYKAVDYGAVADRTAANKDDDKPTFTFGIAA